MNVQAAKIVRHAFVRLMSVIIREHPDSKNDLCPWRSWAMIGPSYYIQHYPPTDAADRQKQTILEPQPLYRTSCGQTAYPARDFRILRIRAERNRSPRSAIRSSSTPFLHRSNPPRPLPEVPFRGAAPRDLPYSSCDRPRPRARAPPLRKRTRAPRRRWGARAKSKRGRTVRFPGGRWGVAVAEVLPRAKKTEDVCKERLDMCIQTSSVLRARIFAPTARVIPRDVATTETSAHPPSAMIWVPWDP